MKNMAQDFFRMIMYRNTLIPRRTRRAIRVGSYDMKMAHSITCCVILVALLLSMSQIKTIRLFKNILITRNKIIRWKVAKLYYQPAMHVKYLI